MEPTKQMIAEKARTHSLKVMDFFSDTREGYALRGKNSFQAGYEECLKDSVIKFDKSFDALYRIAMNMADVCIGQKTIDARFSKLEEEYQEVVEAFDAIRKREQSNYPGKSFDDVNYSLVCELSDLLFVLLHIAHKFQTTPFELLHSAASKMLSRINDVNYKAKI